ncbi:MAG: S-layer homology domain-containing protein [Firmicutes bacterium]|nr:S-layer homology domain-containing protein [Bacillota bacterium]
MKRSIAILLAVLLLLAGVPQGIFADEPAEEAVRYGYRTQTLRYTDKDNAAEGLTATLSLPYYMGSVNAVLNTRLGEAESKVMVLYVPTDKWDGDCVYGAITGRLKPYGISVLPGSDLVIGWKDMYTYGFLDISGGLYSFDNETLIMHFTAGPGLYTGIAAIPVSADPGDERLYEEAVREAEAAGEELDYLPVGFNFVLVLNDEMIDCFLNTGRLEKVSSYDWPGLKELIEGARYEIEPPKPETGMARFKVQKPYLRGQYLDLPYYLENWFDPYVAKTTSYGLMGGYKDGTFRADGQITLAECLVIASNMRDVYNGGDGTFPTGTTPWYNVYVNYAIKQGIIKEGDFEDYNVPSARGEVAYIFAHALPDGVLKEVNAKPRFSDVNASTPYRSDIVTLYQADLVTGYEDGTFHPENPITRAEVCVILSNLLGE